VRSPLCDFGGFTRTRLPGSSTTNCRRTVNVVDAENLIRPGYSYLITKPWSGRFSARIRPAESQQWSTSSTARRWGVLFRLAYLGVTNTFALLRLLPMSDRDKDAEILALRHQIMVLERQLHDERPRFTRADRAWLAALLHPLPRTVLTTCGYWSARRPCCAGTVT